MNKIIIDGKEYDLSAELVEKIKAEVAEQEKVKNPFERKWDDGYFYISSYGVVYKTNDDGLNPDDLRFNTANYCRDKGLMEQRELHETLNRLLWRYAEERNKNLPWDGIQLHYAICYDYQDQGLVIDDFYISKYDGMIYFDYKKDAALAIEEIIKPFMTKHPEFVW